MQRSGKVVTGDFKTSDVNAENQTWVFFKSCVTNH